MLEVLLSLLMALLLITFLTHHYLQRYHYFLGDITRSQNEENALAVYHALHDEIERAGHIGCASLSANVKVEPYHQYSLTRQNMLLVTNDSLQVRYQSLPTSQLKQWFNSRQFSMTNDIVIRAGEIMLISDCVHAEIFTVAWVELKGDSEIIFTNEPLHYRYTDSAEIGRYISHRYYLQNQNDHDCLVRENQHGRHDYLQCKISNLVFQGDEKGVEYQFQLSKQTWSGYAAQLS